MTKFCKHCRLDKPEAEFRKRAGFICNACSKLKCKARYDGNKEAERARARDSYSANRTAYSAQSLSRYRANRGLRLAAMTAYRKNNPHIFVAAAARRRTTQKSATPSWASPGKIKAVYKEASRLTLETGSKYHVDHIVPINSELVCGLHCEANLRVMLSTDNLAKGNRWWPDMP